MCGFCGRVKRTYMDSVDLHRVEERMHHRGPDDFRYVQDSDIDFCFSRLSIQDLSNAHQPMQSLSKQYLIVFNGEIYNYVELRQSLIEEGYYFQTEGDTEVLLALYEVYGKQMIYQLRGMFAFAIWDRVERELFAARDPFGIKPFYYDENEAGFFFSSERKCLPLLGAEHKAVDKEALHHYLTFQYIPSTDGYTDAAFQQLKPGHCLTYSFDLEKAHVERYFQAQFCSSVEGTKNVATTLQQALQSSVSVHMRSDVSVGAFLSGGIDSSTIVALAKEHHPNLQTFTVGFEREGYSEIELAKETADHLGVDNHSYIITAQEVMNEMENIVYHLDEPIADPAAIPNYFVSRLASQHVKVVLSGEGADELFAGYEIYKEPNALKGFGYLPRRLNHWVQWLARQLPEGIKGRNYLIRGTTPLAERYVGNAKIFNLEEKELLLADAGCIYPYTNVTKPLYDQALQWDDSTQMQYIDLHTWLPGDILTVADRMSMAHSIELRVPFLDQQVFEVASMIPQSMKLTAGTTKFILREAAKDILPEAVFNRKKLGFPVPIRHWLQNEMYEWVQSIVHRSNTDMFINKSYVLSLLDEHAKGMANHSRKLWTAVTFMIWHRVFEEERTSREVLVSRPIHAVL
ncbi:asparagine synthase (glutamine-hydrolyzing) [Geomicrobium sediminis]|uniref:asparagine synthase (glutamine-hydrolyzing) n=1 Tax=Geomicrobium sediminis TaxID=1347788 RepID=A0ABS2P853_9BACL|nr:asparagine synthase (glutamine-hydrolyzing) [Geomicrobium sediminis]MBM7631176.1 asparagine synthase (glutamine-hydrolyzing) [Geomicrobium sediminis]